jgi:hypothetical protein
MNRRKLFVSLSVLVVCLLALTSIASAHANGGYIRINNGRIVTNPGQQPQVVVQFGNTSGVTLNNISVLCFWNANLGTPGATYPGPFSAINTVNDGPLFAGTYDSARSANAISLIPGQNYNIAFNINIGLPSNHSGFVGCQLLQNGVAIDYYEVPVFVQ